MPQALIGDCGKTLSTTFTASATANGASRMQALSRAREQAQTILDSWMQALTTCPASCPLKELDSDPDYDAGPPAYAPLPDAADVLVCTVQVARVVRLTCTVDAGANPPQDGGEGGGTDHP